MLILGIETSCDETAAAVIYGEKGVPSVRSNVIASQIKIHEKTGGVVPEVAAREHVIKIIPVIAQALHDANIELKNIDAIAATYGPGLISSLVTGGVTASTLSAVLNKPLIPVNHIEGHIYSNFIGNSPKFPVMILTVSGGHNDLILMKDHFKYEVIGETIDDAAGEAFDKGARILGLSYPGGPAIQKAAEGGNPHAYNLPRGLMGARAKSRAKTREKAGKALDAGEFDFSFSGLKTALLRLIEKGVPKESLKDVAASFQEASCDALSERLIQAVQKYKVHEVHLAGGVSANKHLREMVRQKMQDAGIDLPLRYPENISLCTDNAAMIGTAGYFQYLKNPGKFRKNQKIECTPNAFFS